MQLLISGGFLRQVTALLPACYRQRTSFSIFLVQSFFTSSTLNLWFPDFNSEFLSVLTYLPLSSIFCCLDKFPPVDLVVESGVVPRLVQMLARHDLPQLQLEAAWAITNIACAEVKHARLLIDNGEEIHSQNI